MRRLPGLLVALGLLLAPAAAWPADQAPPQDAPGKPSPNPVERELQRLDSLLYGATPEERERLAEERRRLSAMAAAFGTDPTAIIGFYELYYGNTTFTNNLHVNATTAIVQVPITPNLGFRATLPYAWLDPNRPDGATIHGASDLVVRMGGRLYASEKVVLFIGTDASFPTASESELGTGKYTLGPGAGITFPLPTLRSLLFTVVQDFNSVGGDPGRAHVHYMQVQPAFNTIWSERWWTQLFGTWDMDWTHRRKTTLNMQFEVGHRLDNHWNLYVRPGMGVVGRDTPFGADWSVQAGIRWVYETPLISETIFGGPLGH